jgi:hypothetical protein
MVSIQQRTVESLQELERQQTGVAVDCDGQAEHWKTISIALHTTDPTYELIRVASWRAHTSAWVTVALT